MAKTLTKYNCDLKPVGKRVIVSDMYFGEQTTAGGLIIKSDDGTTRGIYPRWAKVYAKGPENTDPYNVGDWILIEHGRWTRGIAVEKENTELELRMVDEEGILGWSDEKPDDVQIGAEYTDGQHATVDPSSFMNV